MSGGVAYAAMSTCNKCGLQFPTAPAGVIHKCVCPGGMMVPDATPVQVTLVSPTPPIEGRDADVERENMRWFSSQRRLSLDFYSPMYGDDDDQSEEWRVTQESGPINDREWDVIGRGKTVFEAVASACAALQALGERG